MPVPLVPGQQCGLPLKSETVSLSLVARVYPGKGPKPNQIALGERLRAEREELLSTT